MAASAFSQFLMMMYKEFLLRKHHYIVTAIEIFVCLLFACNSLIRIHSLDSPKHGSGSRHTATFYSPFSPFKSDVLQRKINLLFAPNNNNSIKLLNASVNIAKKQDPDKQFTLLGFDTEQQLEEHAILIQSKSVAVIGTILMNFPDHNLQIPKNLEYKIRYGDTGQFSLDTKYSYMSIPRASSAYTDTYFLAWQAAIEQAFINMKSGSSDRTFTVMMNRFPYPPYNEQDQRFSNIDSAGRNVICGFIIFFIVLVKRIVEEKANHSKELLKMMGMTDFVYWSSTFFSAFLFGAVIMLVIAILYTAQFPDHVKVFYNVDFGLVFIIFLLFLASNILFFLALTIFFNRPVFAVCVALIAYIVIYFAILFSYFFVVDTRSPKFYNLSVAQKFLMCLLPIGAIQVALQIIAVYEGPAGFGGWSSINKADAIPDLSLLCVMLMMLLSCVMYSIFIWYVDAVWPWQFGVPKPFYFPFTKSYWCGSSSETTEPDQWEPNNEFFEKDPEGTAPGIVIRNLSKKYTSGSGSIKAVDNISLNIYSGQITALLGRNGAGKTTTINVLAGLFPPTSGFASIDGWDIRSHINKAHSSLGICPQYNILYDVLTVEEHLELYAGIKGVPWDQIPDETSNTLKLLHLENKRQQARSLSGGMKRKLCLGIAVIGGSKVLFLDEPTSGMDVEARRSMWDILLKIRKNRTIVLTTHYMEEADILGDRISIMANGKIQCCGSPMFLKQKFGLGTGYHIDIATEAVCDVNAITLLLQKYIPQVALEDSAESSTLTYSFGTTASGSTFGTMFQELESKKSELGIDCFGITITTMDDVFLKVSMLADEVIEKAELNENVEVIAVSAAEDSKFSFQYEKLAPGCQLWFSQMRSLFLKRMFYAKRHLVVMTFQAVIPFVIIIIFMWALKCLLSSKSPAPLSLDLSSVYGSTEGIYNFQGNADVLGSDYLILLCLAKVKAVKVDDPDAYALNMGIKSISEFREKLSVGATSNNIQKVTAWYNGEPYHILPMSLNLVHEALLRHFTGDESSQIILTNAPLPSSNSNITQPGTQVLVRVLAGILMPLALAFLTACYILVPIHERATRVKLLQLMTGISTFTYWFATFLWDMLVHTILSILLIIPFGIFAGYVFFPHPEAIGSVILLFLLFGWSMLPICYFLSRVIKNPNTGYALILLFTFIVGLVLTLIVTQAEESVGPKNYTLEIFMYFMQLVPIFSATMGFSNLMLISFGNAFCDSIGEDLLDMECKSPSILQNYRIMQCCKDICGNNCFNKTYPITWAISGCGRDMAFLFFDGVLFFACLFFWESGIPAKGCNALTSLLPWKKRIISQARHGVNYTEVDSDVFQEESRIKNMSLDSMKDEAIIITGLTKWYKSLCAVDGLTFGVHKEECFGLLGVNGAGKTTTFKMLAGDILPSKGNASIQNVYLQTHLKQFQSFIGYCPQFDALIDRLTGREMLELFACLRGMPRNVVSSCVNKLIQNVDLQEHADKMTVLYSGGNKRKLSLAMALIGNTSLILLDEPSAGVDPISRRKMWDILDGVRKEMRCAVILCTQSMEECEALCSRLAIMVSGQFRCLGTIQHLKSKYKQGYTISIKLKRGTDSDEKRKVLIHFEKTFPSAKLKDDHQGMFNFFITDTSISWSYLFLSMENMKQTFEFEDYLISRTTLEQIFLAFARE